MQRTDYALRMVQGDAADALSTDATILMVVLPAWCGRGGEGSQVGGPT